MNFIKHYILGWTLGLTASVYGLAALLAGRAFFPGLHGPNLTVDGRGGLVMAVTYLSGGLFLLFRLVVEKRVETRTWRTVTYVAENILLLALIASMIYVLIKVETVQ